MVVVEEATDAIGSQVAVRVRNVIQTTTGRMIFATLEAPAAADSTTS
jgi:uncharacterized protein YacL